MTKELAQIIMAKIDEREKLGYDTLTDSDVMDIIDECNEKGIPCTRTELIEAGIEKDEQ